MLDCWLASAQLLHQRDHLLVDTVLVQRDDLGNSDFLLHSNALNVICDDCTTDSALRHADHVFNRSCSLESLLLRMLVRLLTGNLLLVNCLTLSLLLGKSLIARGTYDFASDGANCRTDGNAFGCFIVLISNDAADDCTSDSALDCFITNRLSVK